MSTHFRIYDRFMLREGKFFWWSRKKSIIYALPTTSQPTKNAANSISHFQLRSRPTRANHSSVELIYSAKRKVVIEYRSRLKCQRIVNAVKTQASTLTYKQLTRRNNHRLGDLWRLRNNEINFGRALWNLRQRPWLSRRVHKFENENQGFTVAL